MRIHFGSIAGRDVRVIVGEGDAVLLAIRRARSEGRGLIPISGGLCTPVSPTSGCTSGWTRVVSGTCSLRRCYRRLLRCGTGHSGCIIGPLRVTTPSSPGGLFGGSRCIHGGRCGRRPTLLWILCSGECFPLSSRLRLVLLPILVSISVPMIIAAAIGPSCFLVWPWFHTLSLMIITFVTRWVFRNRCCVDARGWQVKQREGRVGHTTYYAPKISSPSSGAWCCALAFPFFGRGIGNA